MKALVLPLSVLCPPAAFLLIAAAPVNVPEEPRATGEAAFERWCGTCHADGPRMPGTVAIAVRYNGTRPGALEQWPGGVPRALTIYVARHGIGPMPRFRKTEIDDAELAEIADYLAGTESDAMAGRIQIAP